MRSVYILLLILQLLFSRFVSFRVSFIIIIVIIIFFRTIKYYYLIYNLPIYIISFLILSKLPLLLL